MKLTYELDNQKHEITLEGKKEVLVGRGQPCNAIIPSSDISRIHAKFVINENGCTVMDAGSTNGIFVNGIRVTESAIKEGDTVVLGKFQMRVERSDPAVSEAITAEAVKPQPEVPRSKRRRFIKIASILGGLGIVVLLTLGIIQFINRPQEIGQASTPSSITPQAIYPTLIDQGIDQLIRALEQGQNYDPARQNFQRAAKAFPTATSLVQLVDFLEIKGQNYLRLPWNELELILLEAQGTEHLTSKAQMFLDEKLSWARRESENFRFYTQAQNHPAKDDLEVAMCLLNQIAPDSVYRTNALAEIAKISPDLREKYLLEADQFIEQRNLDEAMDCLNQAQAFADANDEDILTKKDFCKRNIADGQKILMARQLLADGKTDKALETIKTIDEPSLYSEQARALKSKIEDMRTEKPSPEPRSQPTPESPEITKPLPPEIAEPTPEPIPMTPPKTKPPEFDTKKMAKQLERLKQALKERDESTRIWTIRSLGKYPPATRDPLLIEALKDETSLAIRSIIVHTLSELGHKEVIPNLVYILKTKLKDYGITPPEVYQGELARLRKSIRREIYDNGEKPKPLKGLRKRIADARQLILTSYNQKLNLGLLHIRTMEALGKIKSQEATDELYRLLFNPSIPIAYLAIDTLKSINDPKAIDLISKEKLQAWEKKYRKRINFALTELNTPYNQARRRKGTEWILKSIYVLTQTEVNKPIQTSERLMKAFTIMILLSNPECNLYNFSGEDNLMVEFIDLANLLKGNNPEIMLYDYDLLIKYIKDEILTRALYQTFQDVLKPPPPILIPSSTPAREPPEEPIPPDNK